MKALVGAFNQEKALVGAFSVNVKTGCGTDGALHSTSGGGGASHHGSGVAPAPRVSRSVSEVSETGGLRSEI